MRYFFLLLSISLVIGCKPDSASTPAQSVNTEVEQNTSEIPEPEEVDVTLEIKSYEELMELIAAQKGKVVVMDCWATHCAPCVREFHNLVELHHAVDPEKLTCISLSFDFEGLGKKKPEDHKEHVLSKLTELKADTLNILSSTDSDTLYEKLDFGSIPTVFVYSPEGEILEKVTPKSEDDNKNQFSRQSLWVLFGSLLANNT